MSLSLSVLIPCFNEAATIRGVVRRVAAQKPMVKQIVVVNDGSTDNTTSVLQDMKANWTENDIVLNVIHMDKNHGKGAAVQASLEVASSPYVLVQDADLELDPNDYKALAKPIEDHTAEVVFGNRFAKGYPINLRMPSRIANWVVTTLSNALFGMHLKDQACGYKLMPLALAKSLRIDSTGFEVCSEMTAKLGLRHSKIASVPVRYEPRDASQGKKIRWTDGWIAVYTLLKYRLRSAA